MKRRLIVIGALMVSAYALPLGGAHETNSSGIAAGATLCIGGGPLNAILEASSNDPSASNPMPPAGYELEPHFDPERYDTSTGSGVSGCYVMSPANALAASQTALPVHVSPAPPLFPDSVAHTFSIQCDFEVQGNGNAHHPLDEEDVDGDDATTTPRETIDPTGTVTTPWTVSGLVPDGTWDDGGIGGACHTADTYSHSAYNTPGCSGTAHAQDAVSGDLVVIGAACDELVATNGLNTLVCAVVGVDNGTATGTPPNSQLDTAKWCVTNPINCTTSPGCLGGTVLWCGPDGFVETVNVGHGGGHDDIGGPGSAQGADDHTGVVYPNDSSCSTSDEKPFVFVYSAAIESGTLPPDHDTGAWAPTSTHDLSHTGIMPATTGWIDST